MYFHVETLLRQLRVKHRDNQEGQQRAFYTFQELKQQLKRPLNQLKVTDFDLKAALCFIHQVGDDILMGSILCFLSLVVWADTCPPLS